MLPADKVKHEAPKCLKIDKYLRPTVVRVDVGTSLCYEKNVVELLVRQRQVVLINYSVELLFVDSYDILKKYLKFIEQ